jgi:hypothetical protein
MNAFTFVLAGIMVTTAVLTVLYILTAERGDRG